MSEYVNIPLWVFNELHAGRINNKMFSVLVWLFRRANWRNGTVRQVSAKRIIAEMWGDDHEDKRPTERTIQEYLYRFHACHYIESKHVQGQRGSYTVTINNYPAMKTDENGAVTFEVVNVAETSDWRDLPKTRCGDEGGSDCGDASSGASGDASADASGAASAYTTGSTTRFTAGLSPECSPVFSDGHTEGQTNMNVDQNQNQPVSLSREARDFLSKLPVPVPESQFDAVEEYVELCDAKGLDPMLLWCWNSQQKKQTMLWGADFAQAVRSLESEHPKNAVVRYSAALNTGQCSGEGFWTLEDAPVLRCLGDDIDIADHYVKQAMRRELLTFNNDGTFGIRVGGRETLLGYADHQGMAAVALGSDPAALSEFRQLLDSAMREQEEAALDRFMVGIDDEPTDSGIETV